MGSRLAVPVCLARSGIMCLDAIMRRSRDTFALRLWRRSVHPSLFPVIRWGVLGGSLIVVAAWPYLLNLALIPIFPALTYVDFANAVFVAVGVPICIVMLALSSWCWHMAESAEPVLAELVQDPRDRARMVKWLEGRLDVSRQMLAGLAVAALAVVGVTIEPVWYSRPLPSPMLYLLLAWYGFTGGPVLYWLNTVAEFPLQLLASNVSLVWLDPQTPQGFESYAGYMAGLPQEPLLG